MQFGGDKVLNKEFKTSRNIMKSFEEAFYREKLLESINLSSSPTNQQQYRAEYEVPENMEKELDSFIGQQNIKDAVEIAITASMKDKRPLDHMLFLGPPGLGKSTLARKIATILNVPFYSYTGKTISSRSEISSLIRFIQSSELFSVIFIDEIHRISKSSGEELYEVIQDFTYHGEPIKKFTCLGATMYPGDMQKALRERFVYTFRYQPYSIEELMAIAKLQDPNLSEEVALFLAKRSNGVPRVLIDYYKQALNIATYRESKSVEKIHCMYALKLCGIDESGLSHEHIEILKYLREVNKPVGKATLCAALDISDSELMYVIEPLLISLGLIIRVPRGREITPKGIEFLSTRKL